MKREVAGPEHFELRRRLLWITAFRAVATSLLLLLVAIRHLSSKTGEPLTAADHASYAAIASVYVLTLAYALLIRAQVLGRWLGYVQVLGDIILASALVFLSGGADSPFTFVYSLAVVNGAILLYGRGAFFAATLSTFAFLALLVAIPGVGFTANVAFVLVSNALAQFLIAALASYLGRLLSAAGGTLVAREKDLENLGALQRQILSSMPSGLITCSATGRITFVNRAGAAILELETWQSADLSTVLPGLRWQDPDGKRREVEVPTRVGTKTLGLTVTGLDTPPGSALIVFQDLTHLRRMEVELRRADQLAALGRMSAQLAHEIKNPLASMRGSAQLLAEDAGSGPSARLAQILIRESDRLTSLVDAFLKFARPPEPVRQELALESLVQDCLEMLSSDPLSKDVPVELVSHPVRALADPDQLRQVLINVLRNAFEAVRGQAGRVRVALSEAGEMARIEVWDSAGKIAEPHLRRLFEPFFTTRPGGTGLGLSISHSIIQAHGGNIQVSSSPSAGTCFTVLLPLAPKVKDL